MNIGISTTATATSGDLADVARHVEALGFDSLWIPEHPVVPVNRETRFLGTADGTLPEHYMQWADPLIALTVAAGVTENIKLATGICLLAERDPLVTAKAVASLDFYSGGRVIFGVGGGWLKEETELLGPPFGLRWKRLRESVEAMRVLWTEKEAAYAGDLVRFPAVRCEPKPIQKPCPPVVLGSMGPKALERVVRTYDGWYPSVRDMAQFEAEVAMLKRLAGQAGRDPDAIAVTPILAPRDGGPSLDDLKRCRDAGVERVVVYSEQTRQDDADGKALETVKRLSAVVERAQHV